MDNKNHEFNCAWPKFSWNVHRKQNVVDVKFRNATFVRVIGKFLVVGVALVTQF